MKAYKAFNRDMTCRGFKYKVGQVYEIEGTPILCEHGFHFCKDLVLTLAYYPADSITDNCYAEVEILGEIEFQQPTKHKGVTNKLKVLRVIPDAEVTEMVDGKNNTGEQNSGNRNSGDRNSGDRNSGDSNSGYSNSGYSNSGYSNSGDSNSGNRNSGDSNSGNRNSGDRNSGDSNSGYSNSGNRNSGDWNSGDWNSGFFNSKTPETINVFNKPCSIDEWEKSYIPDFLYFDICANGYEESFIESWENADKEDRERVKDLPNFDAEIFFEISGIDLR